MKVVDIADEIYRELGEITSLSIPAIAFWVRTNIGALNNLINTGYSIDSDTVISVSDDGSSVTKVNRNEINRVYHQIKKQEYEELKEQVNAFKLSKATPIQIAGNDTVEGRYSLTIDRLGGSIF